MTAPELAPVLCTECAQPAVTGRFCTGCGAPLPEDVEPRRAEATTLAELLSCGAPDEPAPPWLHTEPPPPVRRSHPDVLAALVLGALVVSGWAIVGGVEEHTLSGTVTVVDADVLGLELGDECFGDGGYDDLNAGAQVVVADEKGTTLSTGRLSSGAYDGLGCVFSFELADVTRAPFYALSVAGENRGELQYSYDELADADWSVELSLGDD